MINGTSAGRHIEMTWDRVFSRSSGLDQAIETKGEFVMFTSKLASVAGLIGAAFIAAAIGPGAATAAFAGPPNDQITIQVSVGDLNLSSEAGAQAALARIHHAAQDICGDDGNRTSLTDQAKLRACIDSTVERAMVTSNLPTLIAVSHGRPVTTAVASANR